MTLEYYTKLQQLEFNSKELLSEGQIVVLSTFLASIIQEFVQGSQIFVTAETTRGLLEFIRFHAQFTLGEMISAMQLMEILLHKSRDVENVDSITADNVGTALVCVCIITQKFLRDKPCQNSWWAKTFKMKLQTLNESEMIILNIIDWKLQISEWSYIHFASRVWKNYQIILNCTN
ncbi:MAG: hypothetical protein EZS28_017910 [Streblomastix strix]|uniref:Cyclin N-terminal domain-containing protein n=1 Tax=Streblomastix strix TaxID=222440 RepID=A0A5J4VVK3_9EUKA|nr:MAG: hypothetical protein EZS28_017910 [Streblomastix strix]